MSFFSNLFKRKPGGTFVGNLIRGAVKSVPVVGGLLGNGAMMISQVDADKRDLSDADFEAKYNATKSNVASDGSISAYLRETLGAAAAGAVNGVQTYQAVQGNNLPESGTLNSGAQKTIFGMAIPQVIGFAVGAIAVIYLLFKRR